jgi:hypothetical protein
MMQLSVYMIEKNEKYFWNMKYIFYHKRKLFIAQKVFVIDEKNLKLLTEIQV